MFVSPTQRCPRNWVKPSRGLLSSSSPLASTSASAGAFRDPAPDALFAVCGLRLVDFFVLEGSGVASYISSSAVATGWLWITASSFSSAGARVVEPMLNLLG